MGEPKQLLEFEGETLVHAAVRAAQEGGCEVVCVVTGHAREAVENAVADLRPLLVHNENWPRGMGGSIRLGVSAIQPASAVVLLACDQPAVNAAAIRALLDLHEQAAQPIVASQYAGTFGIPALFDESCFDDLDALLDDRGAKLVIQANLAKVVFFEFPDAAFDLDSSDDVRLWRHGGMAVYPEPPR